MLFYSTRENLNWQAREFCKEQKRQNIIYTEVRLCPFLFIKRGLTPEEVTQEVLKGLDEGQAEFGIKVRLILTFIKPRPGNLSTLRIFCIILNIVTYYVICVY